MSDIREVSQSLIYKMHGKVHGTERDEWIDIAESHPVGYSGESLRKMSPLIPILEGAGMLNLHPDEPVQCDAYIVEPKIIDRQDPTEEQRLRDLRRELNETYRADARSQALRQSVIEAASLMEPFTVYPKSLTSSSNKKLLVSIADMHYGAEWEIKGLYGETINKYNPEVFAERMSALLQHVIQIMRKEDVYDVVLMMCGDSLDGMLRQSQLMKLRYGMIESCMRFAEYMAQWIQALSEHTTSIDVYNVDGNHSEVRPLGSKRGDFENENLEKIITWHLSTRFENREDVKIAAECSKTALADICGFQCLLTHGSDNNTLQQIAKQTILLYGSKIDFFITGHKHTENEAPNGYTEDGNSIIIRVPSICGTDGFAQRLSKGGKPGAMVTLMEADYGRRCVYPIIL